MRERRLRGPGAGRGEGRIAPIKWARTQRVPCCYVPCGMTLAAMCLVAHSVPPRAHQLAGSLPGRLGGQLTASKRSGTAQAGPADLQLTDCVRCAPCAPVCCSQLGIDDELVSLLGKWSPIPVTYAGGARTLVSVAWAQPAT